MRVLIAVVVALLATGCASIRIEVSVFHDLSPREQSLKYAVVPLMNQGASLEHKAFRDVVRTELNKRGHIETAETEADVIVFLHYGITTGREYVSSYPIIGRTGTQNTYIPAPLPSVSGPPTYRSGTTISTPTYGVVGTLRSTETVFGSYLSLDMTDRARSLKEGRVVTRYEGRVVSVGPSSQVAVVVPAMISALFQDFPGKSGSTRSLELPVQQ